MIFPNIDDFRAAFGIDPTGFDRDTLTFWYLFNANAEGVQAAVSFSVVMKSFQVSMVVAGKEVAMVSSEGVESVRVIEERGGKKIVVSFLEGRYSSGVTLVVEPDVHLTWHALSG